jgi:hypothetical protein
MERGIISLSDIQTGPSTGTRATPAQRVEDAISYATLADRTGLDVFALGSTTLPSTPLPPRPLSWPPSPPAPGGAGWPAG